jgi:glycogen debranching enzyme
MIRIDCTKPASHETDREWLESDGQGGYASSTLENCHTRRYHGLIVANLQALEGRYVLLSKIEDSLLVNGEEHFFTSHRYPGVIFPPAAPILREFFLDICPRFIYRAGEIGMQKSVMLLQGKEALLVSYNLTHSPAPGVLRLKPFLAFRNYHAIAHENPYLRSRTETIENGFMIEPYTGMPPLFVHTSTPSRFIPSPLWYNRFEYTEEMQRGFDWHEDLFLPGIVETEIEAGEPLILMVSVGHPGEESLNLGETDSSLHRRQTIDGGGATGKTVTGENPYALWDDEVVRRQRETAEDEKIAGGFDDEDREALLALLRAGKQFLVTTPSGKLSVIAGYHWFGSWGRDTLIALPGLTFCTGRIAEGIAILTEIGSHEREGLLPNFFSADGAPEAYNTVDSSLLYFRAIQEFLRITGDTGLIRSRFWPVMKRIISRFLAGTRFGIGMDVRGLLHAGEEGTALTWMDATVRGAPVTPRRGYAVEINALWYNALCFTCELATEFDDPEWSFDDLIYMLRRSFRETFWIPEDGYLGDVFNNGVLDRAVRPNQIFAVSLPFSPLDNPEQVGVVRTVRDQLLTPCGIRTLSPTDPFYRGRYRGNVAVRDSSYHQGTVWPWLLGPFGEAALRVAEDREQEKESLRRHIRIFLQNHLHEAGIGSVSEIFDGDPPHRPGGCIAQAWSVAELIRLYLLLRE